LTDEKKDKRIPTYIKTIFAVLVTIGLIAYLIVKTKPRNLLVAVLSLNWITIIFIIVIMCIMFVLKTFRWNYILYKLELKLPFQKILSLVLIGSFGAAVTPAKVGDLIKAYYLSKWKNVKEITSVFSAILDRTMDLVSVGILSIIALPFFFQELQKTIKWSFFAGILILSIILIIVFNSKIVKMIVEGIIKIRTREKGKGKKHSEVQNEEKETENKNVQHLVDEYYSQFNYFKKKDFFFLFSLSMLFWALLGFQVSLVVYSMANVKLNFSGIVTITGIMTVVAIISIVPISLSGIGIRDAAFMYLAYYSLQIGFGVGLGASFIQTGINMILPAIVGGGILVKRALRKRK